MKVAVIDSGIDQNHPAFHDNSLTIPDGFPKCVVESDCEQFTNNRAVNQ